MSERYQVVGIGNAIVDVLSQTDDTFLDLMGIQKGIMQLVERERGELLYGAMRDRTQAPGGSVGNTIAGLGNLGLRAGFIGRVRDDALGRFYAKSLTAEGTDFPNPPVTDANLPTSRSMIFVTPDGERSMNTYLGISAELGPDDVSDTVAGSAEILFLEGYLYDKPKGMQAFERAVDLCHKAGGKAGAAEHGLHDGVPLGVRWRACRPRSRRSQAVRRVAHDRRNTARHAGRTRIAMRPVPRMRAVRAGGCRFPN